MIIPDKAEKCQGIARKIMDDTGGGKGGSGRGEDEKLWNFVIRTVTPLTGKGRIRKEQAPDKKTPPPAQTAPPAPRPDWTIDFGLKPVPAPEPPAQARGSDRRTAARLRRGGIPVEQILDLHGLRQGEAQERLFRFLQNASRSGCRCVLVITGKGRSGGEGGEGGGVLRRALPLWLGLPAVAGLILDFTPAQPRDGGDGACYVLLRRAGHAGRK